MPKETDALINLSGFSGFHDAPGTPLHDAARHSRILHEYAVSVIAVLVTPLSHIQRRMIIQLEESVQPVRMVIMRMRQHGIVHRLNVEPELLRILREEPRQPRIEEHGSGSFAIIFRAGSFVRILNIERQAPLAPDLLAIPVVHKNCYFHWSALPFLRSVSVTFNACNPSTHPSAYLCFLIYSAVRYSVVPLNILSRLPAKSR